MTNSKTTRGWTTAFIALAVLLAMIAYTEYVRNKHRAAETEEANSLKKQIASVREGKSDTILLDEIAVTDDDLGALLERLRS